MGSTGPTRGRVRRCCYCDTKLTREDNYCPFCKRISNNPNEGTAHTGSEPAREEWKKPWFSALLSLVGVGLGQFFNGETIKGLSFIFLIFAVPYVLGIYTTLDPLLFILVIWGMAVADAYISAQKINRLTKSFRKKSVFFWPEVCVLILLATVVILPVVSPHGAAHSASVIAGAVAGTKYPAMALPIYDTALVYAPNDTVIQMDKAKVLYNTGKIDEAQVYLNRIMVENPNETVPVIMTGDLLYESGQYQESISYLDKALSMNRNNAQVWVRKGDAHLAISIIEMQKIRGQFRNLTSSGQDSSLSSDAATMDAFHSTQSYREAINAYNEAIKIDPLISVEISGRILSSTQSLLTTYQGILDDIGTPQNITVKPR